MYYVKIFIGGSFDESYFDRIEDALEKIDRIKDNYGSDVHIELGEIVHKLIHAC